MTYIVVDNCIKCKYLDCVEVCPVDCFYEGENMLVIHPDECIDCGVCEPECPAEAIKADTEPGLEKWLQVNGEEITPAVAAKRPGWTCTKARCTATVKGKSVAYLMGEGPATECTGIDILIARFPLRHACPAVPVRIDRFDVWRKGAYAVYIKPAEIRFETARDAQGNRPWVYEPRPRGTAYRPPDREPE